MKPPPRAWVRSVGESSGRSTGRSHRRRRVSSRARHLRPSVGVGPQSRQSTSIACSPPPGMSVDRPPVPPVQRAPPPWMAGCQRQRILPRCTLAERTRSPAIASSQKRRGRGPQRWLAQRIAADLGSISGEHLGRLAGFKNWKRRGTWVNVRTASHAGRRWDPSVVPSLGENPPSPSGPRRRATDTSPSGREWGWVCGQLEAGKPPELVYVRLLKRACARRGVHRPLRVSHGSLVPGRFRG